jgi:predicted dehydrogenase
MKKNSKTRIGIIGMGLMGTGHARCLRDGLIPGAVLAAACDPDRRRAGDFPSVPWFDDVPALVRSGAVDAVVIATPHYAHTTAGIAALKAGLHVLVEKPVSVHKADVLKLVAAQRGKHQVFAAMFNQRTDPRYRKLRDMVRGRKLGKIRRINWIITDWFRPEAYYRHAGWRATWAGEGGGVLLNQCPHNLDLFQWIFGMPSKVRGFCQFGRYHDIEVEDDVTAYFEYPDGTTAVFIASTGEAPGTNRLEVMGDRGRLVLEGGRLEFLRNEVPAAVFSRRSKEKFKAPPVQRLEIPLAAGTGEQHVGILKNFVRAIRRGEKLIAPASEGLHSVELANAIILSSVESRTVDLPMSAPRYAKLLASLARRSRRK